MYKLPITYNYCLDSSTPNDPSVIKGTFQDERNGITTNDIIPNVQCYINYLNLIVTLREYWMSNAYLDLGMIPIIVAPSFIHKALSDTILKKFEGHNLKLYPMPPSSFLLKTPMRGDDEYWAFRDDVGKFLCCDPSRVTTKAVIEKLFGEVYK